MMIIYFLISVIILSISVVVFLIVKKQKKNTSTGIPVKSSSNVVNINRHNNSQDEHPQRPDSKGKERRYYGDQVLYDKDTRNMEKKALKAYLHGDFYFFWKGKRYRTPEIFI